MQVIKTEVVRNHRKLTTQLRVRDPHGREGTHGKGLSCCVFSSILPRSALPFFPLTNASLCCILYG